MAGIQHTPRTPPQHTTARIKDMEIEYKQVVKKKKKKNLPELLRNQIVMSMWEGAFPIRV